MKLDIVYEIHRRAKTSTRYVKWVHVVMTLFQRYKKKKRNNIVVLNLCSEKLSEWDMGAFFLQLVEKGFLLGKR